MGPASGTGPLRGPVLEAFADRRRWRLTPISHVEELVTDAVDVKRKTCFFFARY
jgi:hypothetical protein